MSHTQHQAQTAPPSPMPPPGVPGGMHTAPAAPPLYSTPAPPKDAPSPAEARAKDVLGKLAAVADKLDACRTRLAHLLGADDLAELNAAVTELQAMAEAPKA